ncbi:MULTISPECIES: sensor histidine kinase [Blautia]|jgi:two-component system sensor histidine kinase YesM|uniref:sensor histidine kinase n=1 Tax=Blautia TaxID=572511 RepID=UPI000E522651|nr:MULTISPECIES: sensor histidine kinase [Blautia]NSG39997.1 sensor histidine kinase [Blautia obeum]RGG60588.1 sensor histidine kinase [Blautia sp. AF19-10LB]
MRSGTKKRMELEERMRKVLFSTMIPMACLMIILLFIFWQYTGQYNKLSENLAVSSEFNLRFKDDLDLEMYYIAIGSKESSDLEDVLEQVEDAQEIMQKLRRNTYNNNGVKSLNSLDSYLENLRQRMLQLVEIKEYDKRMEFMDSNIRIITGLIMQEMQNYIYNESMYLVQVEKSLTHRVKLLISGMAVLLIATLGILMRRSFRLTDGIIHPVNIMLDKVKKVGRGKFDMIPIEAEIEEIEELDEGINKMARKISALLENVRQEKEMQHLTELQLIQAQVNPHFLYNTLDTIVWLIEGGMTDDAVEMISSLSIFFRTSLSKGNDIIPLSEEERHTLSYLEIQQYRYRDILEFEINIPKELSGIPVPKLSIQPLAENALYHGIKNRRGKGKILIEGREEEDALVLTVSDNGQGMTPERLHEVQEAIRTGERAGFGLAAVAERIALYYGPGYGMKIFSEEGKGTTVEIRLGKNIQPKS